MPALQDISNHLHNAPTILNIELDDLPAKLRNKAKRKAAMMSTGYPSPEPSSCLNVSSSSPVKDTSSSTFTIESSSSDIVLPSSPPAHVIPATPPSSSPKQETKRSIEKSRLSVTSSQKKKRKTPSISPPIKQAYITPTPITATISPDQTLAIGRKPQSALSKLSNEIKTSITKPLAIPPQARHASRLHVLIGLDADKNKEHDYDYVKGVATLKVLGQNGCILNDNRFVEYNSSRSWSVSDGDIFTIDLHGCKISISVSGLSSLKKPKTSPISLPSSTPLSLSNKSSPQALPQLSSSSAISSANLVIQRPPLCEINVSNPLSFTILSSPLSEPKSASSMYDAQAGNMEMEDKEEDNADEDEDEEDGDSDVDAPVRQYEFFSDEEADFLSASSSSSREGTPTPFPNSERKSQEVKNDITFDERTPMIKFEPCDENLDDEDDPNRTEDDDQRISVKHDEDNDDSDNDSQTKEKQSYKHMIEIDDVLFGHIASALVFHARSTVFTSEICAAVAEAYRIATPAVSPEHLEKALLTGPFGLIPNRGLKDAQGKPLESSWYYIPDKDSNTERKATLAPFVKKLRTSQTTAKQYYFKRPSLKRKRN